MGRWGVNLVWGGRVPVDLPNLSFELGQVKANGPVALGHSARVQVSYAYG